MIYSIFNLIFNVLQTFKNFEFLFQEGISVFSLLITWLQFAPYIIFYLFFIIKIHM